MSLVVIHYTAGSHQGDLAVLRGGTTRKVSVHYLVGRNDEFGIKALVPEDKVAWHAGKSSWTDHNGTTRNGVNSFSIGIEISNLGPPEAFTDFHYEAVAQLAADLIDRYEHITLDRFVGHNQVSPKRKIDPGPLWDWDRFRSAVKNGTREVRLIRLADNAVVECDPKVENGATRVNLKQLCEALGISPLPTDAALEGCNPVIVPPGVTRIDLRPFAEARGWDVLAHRLAADGKLYLRPHDPSFDDDEDGD